MAIRRTIVCGLLFAGLAAAGAQAGEQPGTTHTLATKVCTLTVSGMTCGGCATAVRIAAMKIVGVSEAKVSYEKGTAVITYDPEKTTPEAIARVITEKSGFKTSVKK